MALIRVAVLSLLLVFSAHLSFAGFGGDDDNGGVNDVPIDGGASLLVGAAIVYGAKKIKEKRKRTTDIEK